MKIGIFSYSMTGNNNKLGEKLSNALNLDHIIIKEPEERRIGKIILDMLFGRKPKTFPNPKKIDDYEYIIFLSPIWMGKIASPMRNYLKYIKNIDMKYSFFSISGGAMGPNPKIEKELKKRTGNYPDVQKDFQKVNLMISSKKPTSQETSDYQITEEDIDSIYNQISEIMKNNNLIV